MHTTDLSMAMPMSVSSPKGRILCVDDEPALLRALYWLLQKEFEVVTADSGPAALERLGYEDFDVIISDHGMPQMSGEQFLNEARKLAPRATRILLVDQTDLQAILNSSNEAEIFRYVSKPWNVSEFPAIVAQAAELARRHAPASLRAQAKAMAKMPASETRILIVDESPDIHLITTIVAGDLAEMVHVTNVVDAIQALRDGNIGVMVTEARLGTVDLTRLICLIKQKHPEIVCIMLGEEAEIESISQLFDPGEIYRFIGVPIRGAVLRHTLASALAKNRGLGAQHTEQGESQAGAQPMSGALADTSPTAPPNCPHAPQVCLAGPACGYA